MSNDVQSHDTAVERAASDRRTSGRHAAAALGAVSARLIGGSAVDLVNFSNRGVLFECDSRLLIGARASVRITSPEHNLVVTGRVVRSRVKGLVNGALRYDAALSLDHEFALTPALVDLMARAGAQSGGDFEPDRPPVEEYLAESEASLAEAVRDREAAVVSDASSESSVADVAGAPADDEAIAFEADGDIAFEPAIEFSLEPVVEFAFEGTEPAAIADTEPEAVPQAADAGVSIFDPTPQAVDQDAGTSMFDATPAAYDPPAVPAFDATETAVAFEPEMPAEADDAVMFEAAFEAPAEALEPPPLPLPVVDDAAAPEAIAAPMAAEADAVVAPEPDAVAAEFAEFAPADAVDVVAFESADVEFDLPADPHAATGAAEATSADVPEVVIEAAADVAFEVAADVLPEPEPEPAPTASEDRVLQQFAATVPQDLAELRRIAADNQW